MKTLHRFLQISLPLLAATLAPPSQAQEAPVKSTPKSPAAKVSPTAIAQQGAAFAKRPLPAGLPAVPRVTCPLYVMEYHVWYRSPFGGSGQPGYMKWNWSANPDRPVPAGPDWMRDNASPGYPLVGFYDSENEAIIRWQLQCAHNAGIDGLFVQLFPDRVTGTRLGGSAIFAKILDIAAQVGIKVAPHDEIQFREGWKAQEPDISAQRAGLFIKKFGKHPAFLRIQGKPAYTFQFWSRWAPRNVSDEELAQMIRTANAVAGEPIFFIPYADPQKGLYSLSEVPGFVVTANSNMFPDTPGYSTDPLDWKGTDARIQGFQKAQQDYPGKWLGLWGYGGFDNNAMDANLTRWLPRQGGKTLVDLLQRYVAAKPNFIMLSSWNDWIENTALEPGLSYEGYAGDPYLYCRILAATKGKTFTPPPLPPKEAIDPLLWQPLYGIDRIPPRVVDCQYLPMDPGVTATIADSSHAVTSAWAAYRGAVCWGVENGQSVSVGVKEVRGVPGGAIPATGLILSPGQDMTLILDPKTFTRGIKTNGKTVESVYVALEFADAGVGSLGLRHSANPRQVDFREVDDVSVDAGVDIGLKNDGAYKTVVYPLQCFDRAASSPFLRIFYAAPKNSKGTVRLTRVHIFTGQERATANIGKDMDYEKGSGVRTFRFVTPPLTGTSTTQRAALPPTAAYLFAEDSLGNQSAPYPAFGGSFDPRRYGRK